LSVQGGKGVKISIDDCLPFLNQNPEEQLRIVHRIDSQTAGIIIFAKTLQAAQQITKLFADRKVKKTYHAVLVGELKKAKGVIKTYISYTDETVMQDDKKFTNSQEAITEYEVLKTIIVDGKTYSIVKFKPLTGRKHQIRIHANWLKSYIVGDDKYCLNKNFDTKKQTFNLQLFATSLQIDGVCNINIEPEFDEAFVS
jgi:23S rRNA-/tRNA-specific pseudouridylate synthase